MSKFEWQNLFFTSSCPGMNANQNFVDDVFRLVSSSSLQENYFYPFNNYDPNPIDKCKCWAVTFIDDINDAKYIKKSVPSFRNHRIAEGNLDYNFGEVIIEGTYIFLWRYKNIKIRPNFKVII